MYAMGLDPIWITTLRDKGYSVSICSSLPEAELVGTNPFVFTSDDVPVSELEQMRTKYPSADLIYLYQKRGVAGWSAVAVVCAGLNIRFVRPGIGTDGLIDLFDRWYRLTESKSNLIAVFGALPGSGVTSVASSIAQGLSQMSQNVIMAGLNLYNPGWLGDAAVSLDAWRQRLISRMLQVDDFELLVRTQGFRYLPGNQDLLATLDFSEDEIEHFLNVAQNAADLIIGDFGSIPESAAWLNGMQRASIRIMVAHPSQENRVKTILKLSEELGIPKDHWLLVLNKAQAEDISLRAFASSCGVQPFATVSYQFPQPALGLTLQKKEKEQLDEAVRTLITGIKGDVVPKKKGWF